jgi:hypothetical protein
MLPKTDISESLWASLIEKKESFLSLGRGDGLNFFFDRVSSGGRRDWVGGKESRNGDESDAAGRNERGCQRLDLGHGSVIAIYRIKHRESGIYPSFSHVSCDLDPLCERLGSDECVHHGLFFFSLIHAPQDEADHATRHRRDAR